MHGREPKRSHPRGLRWRVAGPRSGPGPGAAARWCLALLLMMTAHGRVPFVPAITSSSLARGEDSGSDEPVPPKVRVAVDRGLEWLRRHQQSDGSWPAGASSTTAIPSLAVMAFLARGHTPGQGRYGDLLNRAIDYVLDSQQEDGLLSRPIRQRHHVRARHQHGDARRGLRHGGRPPEAPHRARRWPGRCSSSSTRRRWRRALPSPVGGGTSAEPRSDISVSGWQLMALRAAAATAAPRSARRWRPASKYNIRNTAVQSGGFSDQPGGQPNAARSGTGILVLELLGERNSREARRAGDFLIKNAPTPNNAEFYYLLRLLRLPGRQPARRPVLGRGLPEGPRRPPRPSKRLDGSFAPGSFANHAPGQAYRTSMACLSAVRAVPVPAAVPAVKGPTGRRSAGRWCGGPGCRAADDQMKDVSFLISSRRSGILTRGRREETT